MEKRKLTPAPERKRARAAPENAEAEEPKLEWEHSFKKVSSYSSTSYEDPLSTKSSPMKCLNYVEDDTNSLHISDEDDTNSLLKTPSPVKCTDPTTPSSHPIRILPRKLVIVPSKRKPVEVIVQAILEKRRLASMERRRKLIAGLPELFSRIHLLFQSNGRPVLTKQDLIHKLDIADTNEVEEQLKLLQELASEWIYEKLSSSGDSLICVNNISSPEAMRTRLSEAI